MSPSIPVDLPIFRSLTPPEVQSLSALLESKNLPAGEILYRQGGPSDALYILLSGSLRALLTLPSGSKICVNDLAPGDCAGEMGQFSGQPRMTTLQATADSQLACLPAAHFERLAEGFPGLVAEISQQLLAQYQRAQASSILTGLFGQISDETLHDLLERTTWLRLHSGQELFHQNDPGDALYVVVQGRLQFSVEEANGSTRVLGEVCAGETVGEFALLAENGSPESLRSATVYATRLTDLVAVSRPVFESLICQYPQAVLNLTRRIVRRQRLIDQSVLLGSSAMVICVLPVCSGLTLESPHSQFARQLAETFNSLGCTLLVDPARFESWYGKPGASRTPLDHPTSLMINAWLDEKECQQQFVIFDTTPDAAEGGRLSAWAQRCVEDADLILLVGQAGEHSAPGEIERILQSAPTRAPIELVLLHPDDCPVPSQTAAWLSSHKDGAPLARAHHHVRLGNAADLRRLTRRISGQAVGLVLGGGGARGWAHIGAIQALEEAGIEVDWVGGASIGSIIAAGYALGWSPETLSRLASGFADPKKLLDYTFPYASVTATQRISNLLQQICGDADIEDTWRPFFCVSANLTRGEEQMHLAGKLWRAIRASMAFPAVFAPFLEDGCVLIDGGAANNLPVDRMRELCPTGTVIGVNLLTSTPVKDVYNFGPGLSGWQALFSRFSPFGPKIKAPNLLDIVAGLIYSNNRYRLNETHDCADLLIDVPVEAFGLLDFDKYAQIVELGYNAAKEQLQGYSGKRLTPSRSV